MFLYALLFVFSFATANTSELSYDNKSKSYAKESCKSVLTGNLEEEELVSEISKTSEKKYSRLERFSAILLVRQSGGDIIKISRELDIDPETLREWVSVHEEKYGIKPRYRFTKKEKLRAILMVEVYEGNVSKVAKHLGLNQVTVYRWVREYEKEQGVQIRNAISKPTLRRIYTIEDKTNAIRQVKDNGGNVAKVAKELNIHKGTLSGWIYNYIDDIVFKFSRHGNSDFELNYSKAQKSLAIELVKVVGGDVFKAKEKLHISLEALDNIIMEYEITTGDIIISVYEVKKIVDEFHLIRNSLTSPNRYSNREKALAVELVKVLDGNLAIAIKRLQIPSGTLHNWWKKDRNGR